MAFSFRGPATCGVQTDMERHYQWAVVLIHYSSLVEWYPRKEDFSYAGLRQCDPLSPMLFILVMDVLGHMFSKAAADDMLQPLARRVFPHQISIYADDVVLFIQLEESDIALTMDILHLFGIASGLKTNL
jgi:hypothetical protein